MLSHFSRLDFTKLVLKAQSTGAVTTDYLTVDGPTDVDPPAISGTNTGYHSKQISILGITYTFWINESCFWPINQKDRWWTVSPQKISEVGLPQLLHPTLIVQFGSKVFEDNLLCTAATNSVKDFYASTKCSNHSHIEKLWDKKSLEPMTLYTVDQSNSNNEDRFFPFYWVS